jgi:hypothetical protein
MNRTTRQLSQGEHFPVGFGDKSIACQSVQHPILPGNPVFALQKGAKPVRAGIQPNPSDMPSGMTTDDLGWEV